MVIASNAVVPNATLYSAPPTPLSYPVLPVGSLPKYKEFVPVNTIDFVKPIFPITSNLLVVVILFVPIPTFSFESITN